MIDELTPKIESEIESEIKKELRIKLYLLFKKKILTIIIFNFL